jgi:hypothetical protein
MNDPEGQGAAPEFSDSDRAWFAALSGQATPAPGTAATREGQALRAALAQRIAERSADPGLAAATSDEAMQAQLQRLRQRMQAEGTFAPPPPAATAAPPSNVIAFPWWRRRVALVGMAASVLAAVLVVQMMGTRADYPVPPEMMGADGRQPLQVAAPRPAAEQLAARLREAGLRPGLYQRGGTYVVDVTLAASQLPAAEPGFAALGLKPAPGFNRVEFTAR